MVSIDGLHLSRERLLAAIAIANSYTAIAFRDGFDRFLVRDESARKVLKEITSWESGTDRDDALSRLQRDLGPEVVDVVTGDKFARIHPAFRKPCDGEIVLHEFAENIARISSDRNNAIETREAEDDIDRVATESLTWRLGQSALARANAHHGDSDDKTEYETHANGARMKKDERSAFDALLGQIDFEKGGQAH
jgi:DNA primase